MHNRYLCGLAVALGLLAGTISTKAQPNLVPYKPSGWSDKIVATTNSVGTTDTPNLTTLSDIYIDWAVANTGSAATSVTTDVDLYLDGELDNFWSISPPFDPSTFEYIEGYELGTLSAGTHTIVIVGDGTGVYGESDDTYTKTITVSAPSTPDLVPYKPSGWSDKIVVTRTSGSTNDSTNLTTADSLYLDWAVINSGSVATAATFYTYLYYDGVYVTDWSTPAPLNINSYTYVTGYSLGSLSAGNHSLEIYANATGTISETNTANNIYTKNITVSQPTLPAPALLAPANGGTGVAQSPTFSWSAVSGAASYRLIAATSAADLPSNPSATSGGPSVLLNVTTTNTSYSPWPPLAGNTTYYWEVQALASGYVGLWSGTNSFTTQPLANAITINVTFDSTITSDPQAATIEATLNSVAAFYEARIATPITVAITFKEMTSGLGQSDTYFNTITYSEFLSALTSSATSADDATALAHLSGGAGNPVTGNTNFYIKTAHARALGFNFSPPAGQPDGAISLYTGIMNLSPSQTNSSYYSLFGAACHELDEVLGLGSALDLVKGGVTTLSGPVDAEDLYRYDGAGNRSYTTNINAVSYFSLDGTTDLAQFNQVASGDFGDWYSYYGGVVPQVQDAYATPGTAPIPHVELRALDVIGYSLAVSVAAPLIQSVTYTNSTISFTWTATPGQTYQVQDATNATQTVWSNTGNSVTPSGSTGSFSGPIGPAHIQFYRVALLGASNNIVAPRSSAQVGVQAAGISRSVYLPGPPQ